MSLHVIDIWTEPASIGAFTYFGTGTFHNAEIGRYCSVADGLRVGVGRHPTDFLTSSPVTYVDFLDFEKYISETAPGWTRTLPDAGPFEIRPRTKIGNDVWIGVNTFIKDGVTIGDGAIVGAHSVVTRDVEPYKIVGGNPARVIRSRFSDTIVDRLLALRWWRYNIYDFAGVNAGDIASSIDRIEELEKSGALSPYSPQKINIWNEFARYKEINGPA